METTRRDRQSQEAGAPSTASPPTSPAMTISLLVLVVLALVGVGWLAFFGDARKNPAVTLEAPVSAPR